MQELPGRFRRLMDGRTMRSMLAVFLTALCFPALSQVVTSQNDNARTNANLHETTLTPANVNARQFGRINTLKVDGDIYAQPLYLPNVEMPGKGRHNVLFVATEHDSVYAFDADGSPKEPLWHVNFLDPQAGIRPVPAQDAGCPFIVPEIGITPTPVIDLPTGTLYVLARTRVSQGALKADRYEQRLHALAITTGVEKFGGPAAIEAPGFDPLRELPRAGLLLVNGQVYLTWASSCDVATYHGWVMAYDAHTLSQTAAFNTSPGAGESGIWQSDNGPAADEEGHVYLATGNGQFNAGRDYGDTVLKLGLEGRRLAVRDSFTPDDQRELNARDLDIGSGGPMLTPNGLLLVGGKDGKLYVLDRGQMGKAPPRRVIQFRGGIYSAPGVLERARVHAGELGLPVGLPAGGRKPGGAAGGDGAAAVRQPGRDARDFGQRKAERDRVADRDEGVEWSGPSGGAARVQRGECRGGAL